VTRMSSRRRKPSVFRVAVMLLVQLSPGLRGGKWARLRPLCGHDETLIDDADSDEGIALLDRLLVEAPGTTVGPGKARNLAVCDTDRLYATIYLRYFGDLVEGAVGCRDCGEPFEVSFSLRNLLVNLEVGAGRTAGEPDEDGIYRLSDGRRFRLPTVSDLQAVLGLETAAAAGALLERCMISGDAMANQSLLQNVMDEVGPVLDLDLDAACPRCGVSQSVRFGMRAYLLRTLAYEKRFLVREIHLIAGAYRWGYEEILSLTREDRRAFVSLIQAEREARRRGGP
jgi:hypothetical protein